jgi:hypothetical protein
MMAVVLPRAGTPDTQCAAIRGGAVFPGGTILCVSPGFSSIFADIIQ